MIGSLPLSLDKVSVFCQCIFSTFKRTTAVAKLVQRLPRVQNIGVRFLIATYLSRGR